MCEKFQKRQVVILMNKECYRLALQADKIESFSDIDLGHAGLHDGVT